MESFIHADIFFFVTTIAVSIFAAIMIIVLIYVASILHDLKQISAKVRKESEEVINDLHSFREHIKTQGPSLRYFYGLFRGLMSKAKAKKEKN